MRPLFALVPAILMSIAVVAAAQPPDQPAAVEAPPQGSATVDDVVALNLKARGGVELLRATDSMKMTGTVTSPVGQAKMTNWVMRPNRKRTETNFGGQKNITQVWSALNAAMIAHAALLRHRRGQADDPFQAEAESRIPL